jgi:hypothetical protein
LYLAKYEHQNAYSDAASGTICPVSGAAQVTCSTGALGPPKNSIVRLTTIEFRDAYSSSLAFAVSYHHDFQARVNSVEIPVYLFKDGKSGLSGGVTAGWRSDNNNRIFGIFVSAPFSLIP